MVKEYLILTIQCNAPKGLFAGDFDDLSTEHQELFKGSNRANCEGGRLGRWCMDCRFGDIIEERGLEIKVVED